jgi:hypothetical protein
MGSERRKFVRYDIAPIPSVKAVLHDGRVPTKLGTIGMGGCGFWAEKKDDTLQMGQEVKCSISFDGILPKSIEVSGLIQYCNTAEFEGKTRYPLTYPNQFIRTITYLQERYVIDGFTAINYSQRHTDTQVKIYFYSEKSFDLSRAMSKEKVVESYGRPQTAF